MLTALLICSIFSPSKFQISTANVSPIESLKLDIPQTLTSSFFRFKDKEIEQDKTAGTKAEAEADPDNVFWPGHHVYDPDHSSGIYQKTKALRYEQFIAPLIKAVQELSAENDALKARVTTLEG